MSKILIVDVRLPAKAKAKAKAKTAMPNIKLIGRILSKDNLKLLRIIREQQPSTINKLVEISGREHSDLSRTISKLASYGLVKTQKIGRCIATRVDYQSIQINVVV